MTTKERRCKFCDVIIVSKKSDTRPDGAKLHGGRGYCITHYKQHMAGGPMRIVNPRTPFVDGTPCSQCDSPMTRRTAEKLPSGWRIHAGRGVCKTCRSYAAYRNSLAQVVTPAEPVQPPQLTEQEAWTTTVEKPFSDEMMSRLSAFSPETFTYMVGRRRRGIPAIGVGQTTPKQQQAGAA